ncbi:leucine-rich repeat domain-containing protein [Brasilonema sp. CT11]|nr:leucine-rich repeat domain-containing protein [Brasilonema sp. CT11]
MSETRANQTNDFSSFADWCLHKDSLSPEARHTIEVLLKEVAYTSDCQEAQERLARLTKVNIYNEQISDFSPLQSLTNLTKLDLSQNQISDLNPLQNLKKLTCLNLSANQISDCSPLQFLTNLSILYLNENQIVDVTPLQFLTNLTFLSLSKNPVVDESPLQSLKNTTIKISDKQPIDISFENWVKYLFEHPVTEPAWHWQDGEDWLWDVPPEVTVAYVTKVFENPQEVFQSFSDAQVNQGLWYLIFNVCSNHIFALLQLDNGVAWLDRQRCIRSIFTLFEKCFAQRCSPHLSYLNEPDANAVNSVCYMWWDIFPWYGHPDEPMYQEMDEEFIDVMQRTLLLDSTACQESALHGLGHWQMDYPEKITAIIDDFLARNPQIRPELKEYALNARVGYVQ